MGVQYDPATQKYGVFRARGGVQDTFPNLPSLEAAEAQIDAPYRVALRPTESGRYYYNLSLDLEVLTVSDLDALQRWLRGEGQPAAARLLDQLGQDGDAVGPGIVQQHDVTAPEPHAADTH